jgi:hypothetical protein
VLLRLFHADLPLATLLPAAALALLRAQRLLFLLSKGGRLGALSQNIDEIRMSLLVYATCTVRHPGSVYTPQRRLRHPQAASRGTSYRNIRARQIRGDVVKSTRIGG